MGHPSTEAFWGGPEGDAYTERNRVDWRARIPFWCKVIAIAQPDNAFEVGANCGWNLRAIREVSPGMGVHGIDVNRAAVKEGRILAGLDIDHGSALNATLAFPCDLVFTAGVLIHVPPDALTATMEAIADASSRYVLAIEYAADEEQEIEYRGQMGLLWKRNYGALYEALGLRLVDKRDAGPGFDNCTAWLLEKR